MFQILSEMIRTGGRIQLGFLGFRHGGEMRKGLRTSGDWEGGWRSRLEELKSTGGADFGESLG